MIYGIAGGYFAWFALIHLIVDFGCQSNQEAMNKHHDARIRARHCLIYTLGFLPVLWLFGLCWWKILIASNILFWSHFGEDTYYPVVMWMKYIRRAPAFVAMTDMKFRWRIDDADKRAFRTAIQEPIGTFLMIAIDQAIHLLFLIPIVWMTVR
jgi:uncharacterized protein DUF3307